MARDYYELLGLTRSASESELKAAYHKLALQYHPDRNPGDKLAEAKFKEIQQAYNVLADKEKRKRYDQFGESGVSGQAGGGGQQNFRWGPGMGGFQEVDPADAAEVFRQFQNGGMPIDMEDFFGAAGRTQGRSRAKKVRADVEIPFKEAVLGGVVPLRINDRTIDLKIPSGMEHGKELRLKGQGPGGSDLLLKIIIQPHPFFRREGQDLVIDVPIAVSEAVLGGTIEVPTLDGKMLGVKIPPGTSSGVRMRLRGRGVNGGDQFVVIRIETPSVTDIRSKELMEEFSKLNPQKPRAGLW